MRKIWLGLTDYNKALQACREAEPLSIVGSENHPTITLGRRSLAAANETRHNLPNKFEVCRVDRGGHATLHNPGQLVIYPRLHLPSLELGVRDYVSLLGRTTVQVLNDLGIASECSLDGQLREPGIYTDQGKIAFVGVRIERGMTSHGVSINVSNELADFQWIRSCSIWDQPVASLKSLGIERSPSQVFEQWCGAFNRLLPQSFSLTPKPHLSNVSDEYSSRV